MEGFKHDELGGRSLGTFVESSAHAITASRTLTLPNVEKRFVIDQLRFFFLTETSRRVLWLKIRMKNDVSQSILGGHRLLLLRAVLDAFEHILSL